MSFLTPSWSIWVSDDPVLSQALWINTPSNNQDCMSLSDEALAKVLHRLWWKRYLLINLFWLGVMGYLHKVSSFFLFLFVCFHLFVEVINVHVLSIELSLGLGQFSKLFELPFNVFDSFFGYDSTLVGRKVFVSLELNWYWTVSENVLHHLLLGNLSVTTSNKVSIHDLCFRSTVFIWAARMTFSLSVIRGALLRYHVSMFHEVRVKVRPSSLTSLNKEITVEDLLWRQFFDFLSILKL